MIDDNINALPENVFCKRDTPPTAHTANSLGKVLWFSPSLGWMEGNWQWPTSRDATHWTYAPERPPIQEDPKVQRETAFKAWLQAMGADLSEPALALMELGFNAGWDRR